GFRPQPHPLVGAVRDPSGLRFARDGTAKHEAHRTRTLTYRLRMLPDVLAKLADDELVYHLRSGLRHGLGEVIVELQSVAALAGTRVRGSSHVGAPGAWVARLRRHRRIVGIVAGGLQGCSNNPRLSILPWRGLIGRRAMAILAQQLYLL